MKRILFVLAFLACFSLAGQGYAIPPSPPGTALPSTCTNGQAVVYNSTTEAWDTCAAFVGGGDMLASVYVTTGKIKSSVGGMGIDSSGSTGFAYDTAGTWTVISAATARTNLGLVIGVNVLAPDGSAASLTSFPTLDQNTTGSAGSVKSPSTSGLATITGMGAGTTRVKTVRDANDTVLELGGSYTPTGTWNWGTASVTWPTFNQSTSGLAGTATALAANGANCSAGSYPLGVDASGAVESCTAEPTAASLHLDDLLTAVGIASTAVNMGTFSGSTIADNQTAKEAIQALETAFEGLPGGHTQNTDTGTNKATFLIDSGSTGVRIKNNSLTLEARNAADAAYAPFKALTIEGTVITATTNFAGNLTGAVTGNADTATTATTATNITVADTTDTTTWVVLATDAAANVAPKTDGGLTYNAGTGVLTATGFSGPLTGNVTGNASGTAATVTGAAQAAITSVGTLTGLTVSGAIIPNAVGTIDLGSTSAELRNIFLGNSGVLYGQIDQSATLTSSASTWTASALTSTGTFTANGNVVIGNADTDTFTIQSMIIGGNSRAVQIAASVATPTYALSTNELYVAGDIETAANVYAAAFIGGAGTDGQRRVSFTNNTTFDCASYPDSIYFIGDAPFFCVSTAAKTPMRLEDAQTVTGVKTFSAGLYSGDDTTNSGMRFYDGSSNYWTVIAPTGMSTNPTLKLPSAQGSINQYLYDTDGAGTMGWGTPTATAAGSAGSIQYTSSGAGGAFEGSAFFTYVVGATYADVVIGGEGTGRIGRLGLAYEGGASDYTVTLQPNSAMAADITVTMPSAAGTLLTSAGSETWTGNQIYSSASNNSTVSVLSFTGVPAQNASDVHRGIYFAPTGAVLGTITGTGNTVAFIDIAALTGDANANLYGLRIGALTGTTGADSEVEHGINIGAGWDYGIYTASPVQIASTGSLTLGSTTGPIKGSATFWGATSGSSVLSAPDAAGSSTAIVLPATAGTLMLTTGTPAAMVIASQAAGDLLYASSSSAWARLIVAGQPGYTLTSGTTAGGTTPLWQAPGAAGTFYRGAGTTTTPTWSTSTFADTYVIGGLVHAATANTMAALAPGAVGSFLMSNGNAAALSYLAAGAANYILVGAGTTTIPVWTQPTGTGAPVLANTPTLITPELGAATATSVMATGRIDGTVGITESSEALAVVVATHGHSAYFINSGADEAHSTFTLPAAEAGLQYCFRNATAIEHVIQILAVGDDVIDLDGADSGAAGYIHSDGTILGASACVVGVDATHWYAFIQKGTWTVHTAP